MKNVILQCSGNWGSLWLIVLGQLDMYMEELILTPALLIHKYQFLHTTYLKWNIQKQIFQKKIIGHRWLWAGKHFLHRTKACQQNIDIVDHNKTKYFCLSKYTIKSKTKWSIWRRRRYLCYIHSTKDSHPEYIKNLDKSIRKQQEQPMEKQTNNLLGTSQKHIKIA